MVRVMLPSRAAVLLIVIRLKVIPEASIEVLPPAYVPPKVTAPPLALKVGVPVLVKLCEIVITPDVEVNVPPEIMKLPVIVMATLPPVNVPPA